MKYFERRRKAKLYRQWVERAGLPLDAILLEAQKPGGAHRQIDNPEPARPVPEKPPVLPVRADNQVATHPDVTGNMIAEINRRKTQLPILYILRGIFVVIFLGVLVLLVVWAC